jgi:hypothetical protein
MSYIRGDQRAAFEGSEMERLDCGSEIIGYKLTPPKRFHWCYILFTPLGVIIGGDQRFGEASHGTAVASGMGLDFFLKAEEEDYLASKFFGRKPSGKVAASRWVNDAGWMAALRNEFARVYRIVPSVVKV